MLLTVLAVQRTACGSRPHGKTLGGFGGAAFWVDQTPEAHRAYRETEGDAIRRQSGSIANYRCDHDRYTQNSRINASPEAGDSEQQPAQRKQQVAAQGGDYQSAPLRRTQGLWHDIGDPGAHEGVEPHVASHIYGAGYRYAQRHQTESAGLASLALEPNLSFQDQCRLPLPWLTPVARLPNLIMLPPRLGMDIP